MLDLTIFSKLFIENFHQLLEDVVTPKNHQTANEAMMPFKVRHKIIVCMLEKTKQWYNLCTITLVCVQVYDFELQDGKDICEPSNHYYKKYKMEERNVAVSHPYISYLLCNIWCLRLHCHLLSLADSVFSLVHFSGTQKHYANMLKASEISKYTSTMSWPFQYLYC